MKISSLCSSSRACDLSERLLNLRYNLVLFHAEQILGVGNICSVDDLIENDRSPLYCLLGLLFYLKPSLECEIFAS